jgi:hypothetical protein
MLIAVNEFKNLLRAHKEASAELRQNAAVLNAVIHDLEAETSKTRRIITELNTWKKKLPLGTVERN